MSGYRMLYAMVIGMLFLYLPVDVFAHVGHVEWAKLSLASVLEWLEASVVIAALGVYLLTVRYQSSKNYLVKSKRLKK